MKPLLAKLGQTIREGSICEDSRDRRDSDFSFYRARSM